MTKIQGSHNIPVSPQSEVQPSATTTRPTSSQQASSESASSQPLSLRDASRRRGEHNLGGLVQELRLKDGGSKQDIGDRARELMRNGQYGQAAQEVRTHIGRSTVLQQRFRPFQRQAEVLSQMQSSGVQSLQYPPSQQNVRDYFRTMRGQPIADIQTRFQNYANAFYSHSASGNFATGDLRAPSSWSDLNRYASADGRHRIDCEGFAMLGHTALRAAGFRDIRFADMRPAGGAARHIVIAGERRQQGSTEIALISNNNFRIGSPQGNQNAGQARTQMVATEFNFIMVRPPGQGDRIVEHRTQRGASNAP